VLAKVVARRISIRAGASRAAPQFGPSTTPQDIGRQFPYAQALRFQKLQVAYLSQMLDSLQNKAQRSATTMFLISPLAERVGRLTWKTKESVIALDGWI